MRALDAGLTTHLQSGTTTLCHCWRLTLRSGEKLGFTDHDEALIFENTTFEAQAGFTGTEIESSLGLSVDNLEASGALQSGQLDETRLSAGDYDHATIEIWRVNWQNVAQRFLQRKGNLGEVSYGQGHFTAEVRGLAHILNQPKGRLFQFGCDAVLGDARCTANLVNTAVTVTAINGASYSVSGLGSFADDWFTRGQIIWLTGINAGRSLTIKRQLGARLDLWSVPKFAVALGEQMVLTAGCDKLFSTCKTKFNNAINFRGFPHMPGSDFVMKVAATGENNTGGRLG
jgi:uncharacterized phage protein (TIGR02218 family)